jgi:2-dehydro-3-deoxyphosphooctonate aldolase (KDO 8-P synthase)
VLENLDLALGVGRHLQAITTGLGLPLVFKASFDKANRSSIKSYRGPGLKEGLAMLAELKHALNVPVATDVHEIDQVEPVAAIADLVQIPAFLCRQTDLVVAAARATRAAGGWLHVKKAQFLAPWDCKNIITKAREAAPGLDIVLCERGSSFGYNNLVVDMLGIGEMQRLGVPVTIDATHAVQLPGADPAPTAALPAAGAKACRLSQRPPWRRAPTAYSWNSTPNPTRRCATGQAACRSTRLRACFRP